MACAGSMRSEIQPNVFVKDSPLLVEMSSAEEHLIKGLSCRSSNVIHNLWASL